jgi:hypothetical protein
MPGTGRDDAARPARQEDRLVELAEQVPCVRSDVARRQHRIEGHLHAVELRRFEIVRLAIDVFEFLTVVT